MDGKAYIDIAGGLARVGGNEGLYRRSLAKFEDNVDIEGFNRAVTERDYALAGEIARDARQVAGNLSLTAFFDASTELTDQLRNGGLPTLASLSRFRELYEGTRSEIAAYLGL